MILYTHMIEPIVDSLMSLNEAIAGTAAPQEVVGTLTLIDVDYLSFDGKVHRGQLVVHKNVADELKGFFAKLLGWKFPIEKVIPVVAYEWSDERSMAANNTSAFNYRMVYGTDQPSNHSFGTALDINPALNPYVAIDGKVFPEGAVYDTSKSGTLAAGDRVVSMFESAGWDWGGKGVKVKNSELKDWQHFQKLGL